MNSPGKKQEGALRRISSTSSISSLTSPPPVSSPLSSVSAPLRSPKWEKGKVIKKVALNQLQYKGLVCLHEMEILKNWIEEALGIKIKGDLATALGNGVLLCNLMNKIREGSIPNIHQAKSQAYLSMENINFFLSVCIEIGVTFNDIFTPLDLYEKKNIPKVVKCVLLVGGIATKHGFQPPLNYKPREDTQDSRSEDSSDEEIIEVNSGYVSTDSSKEESALSSSFSSEDSDLQDGLAFPDLDRTITDADIQALAEAQPNEVSWPDSSSSDTDSPSDMQDWSDKSDSPVGTTEYTVDELKLNFPGLDISAIVTDLIKLEVVGRSTHKAPQHHVIQKYHYKGDSRDLVDQALADYINTKFSFDVPQHVSLPKPIIRLGKGKYRFEDRVVNLKLTNGSLLVRVGGGWMKLKEVFVRLSSMAACAALKDKTQNSILRANISEWTDLKKISPSQTPSPSTSPSTSSSPSLSPSSSPSSSSSDSPASSPSPQPSLPPMQPLKPFPKIPPLKLPTKPSKPTLGSIFTVSAVPSLQPPQATTRTPPRPGTPDAKPKISPQRSLPTLPSAKSKKDAPQLLGPHTQSAPPTGRMTRSLPLTVSLNRSVSFNSTTPRRSTLSETQVPHSPVSTPRRSTLSDIHTTPRTPTTPNTPKTPTTPKFPTTPPSPNSPTLSVPAIIEPLQVPIPMYDLGHSPRPTQEQLSSPNPSFAPDSPFRSPLLVAAPKLAILKPKST